MSEHLRVNTAAVHSLADNLQTIRGRLSDSGTDSSTLADMIPVAELSGAVHDFASKWDVRRKGLVSQVDTLQKQASTIAQGFEDLDNELVKELTAKPKK